MLGPKEKQAGMIDYLWIQHLIPKDSLYYFLHHAENELLKDQDFAHLYSQTQGRLSKNPVTMSCVLLLMAYEGISDREAEQRTRFDNRWKFALHRPLDSEGIDHTTICNFRLLLRDNDMEMLLFQRVLEYAQKHGVLKDASVQAIDSTLIRGAAAVKGTYDLIAASIFKVLQFTKRRPRFRRSLLKKLRLSYETSKKPSINWDDETAQNLLLNDLLTDARVIMETLATVEDPLEEDFVEAVRVLGQVTDQDVEQTDTGRMVIKRGTEPERVISVVDPEMRHARKSPSKKINGYKVSITTDLDSELITGIHTHPATEADSAAVDELLRQQEEIGIDVKVLMGDSAYGSGKQRQQMEEKGIDLLAKTPPATGRKDQFSKDKFHVYPDKDLVRCPAGKQTKDYTNTTDNNGDPVKVFRFQAKKCNACPLKPKCTSSDKGRTIRVGAHETQLQEGRRRQRTQEFRLQYKRRATVERKIYHVKRPNQGKSRYIGYAKTGAQMIITAAATNLRAIAGSLCTRIFGNQQTLANESQG